VLTPPLQAIADEIYQGMLRIEAMKAAQEQQALEATAEEKGRQNAARPSQPDAPSAAEGSSDLPTPNQPGDQNVPDRR
jgi:hypothetical protein